LRLTRTAFAVAAMMLLIASTSVVAADGYVIYACLNPAGQVRFVRPGSACRRSERLRRGTPKALQDRWVRRDREVRRVCKVRRDRTARMVREAPKAHRDRKGRRVRPRRVPDLPSSSTATTPSSATTSIEQVTCSSTSAPTISSSAPRRTDLSRRERSSIWTNCTDTPSIVANVSAGALSQVAPFKAGRPGCRSHSREITCP
jgi:hypothetical protein